MRKKKPYIFFVRIFFFSVVLILSSAWLLSLPFWNIKEIVIVGNNVVSGDDIKQKANISSTENIFFVNYGEIKRRIKSIPQIKNVSASGRLPNSIDIKIEERQPFAVFIVDGRYFVVDEEGYIIKSSGQDAELPAVIGLDKNSIEGGKKIASQIIYSVHRSLKILSGIFKKSRFGIEMKDINNISIIIDDVLKVKLGSLDDTDKKLSVMSTILNLQNSAVNRIEYIDVRVPENPAIKFRQ